MDFLGIGPMELVFIVIIALIVLGPKDMAKTSKSMGKFMRDVVKSDTWKAINTTTRELKHLPNRMMREAGLDENIKELDNITRSVTAEEFTRTIKPPSKSEKSPRPASVSPEDAAFSPEIVPAKETEPQPSKSDSPTA